MPKLGWGQAELITRNTEISSGLRPTANPHCELHARCVNILPQRDLEFVSLMFKQKDLILLQFTSVPY